MAILKLRTEPERRLSDKQMRRVLALVEEQVFRHPDDITDVDDRVDDYTIEVAFYTYADEITIKRDEDGDPMAFIFDDDREVVQPDTDLFVERVQEMVEEANEILLAAYDKSDDYFDDDYGDYYY